jgi:hypothetical protein
MCLPAGPWGRCLAYLLHPSPPPFHMLTLASVTSSLVIRNTRNTKPSYANKPWSCIFTTSTLPIRITSHHNPIFSLQLTPQLAMDHPSKHLPPPHLFAPANTSLRTSNSLNNKIPNRRLPLCPTPCSNHLLSPRGVLPSPPLPGALLLAHLPASSWGDKQSMGHMDDLSLV